MQPFIVLVRVTYYQFGDEAEPSAQIELDESEFLPFQFLETELALDSKLTFLSDMANGLEGGGFQIEIFK